MKYILFFLMIIYQYALQANNTEDTPTMSDHVFVVSEWLPKENCEEELFNTFKQLMSFTAANEKGCVSARATRQVAHPGAAGTSQYKIVLLQEYVNIDAFNAHCQSEYVHAFVEKYLIDPTTSPIQEWRCRLFSEK